MYVKLRRYVCVHRYSGPFWRMSSASRLVVLSVLCRCSWGRVLFSGAQFRSLCSAVGKPPEPCDVDFFVGGGYQRRRPRIPGEVGLGGSRVGPEQATHAAGG
jgi:hypothetical protein